MVAAPNYGLVVDLQHLTWLVSIPDYLLCSSEVLYFLFRSSAFFLLQQFQTYYYSTRYCTYTWYNCYITRYQVVEYIDTIIVTMSYLYKYRSPLPGTVTVSGLLKCTGTTCTSIFTLVPFGASDDSSFMVELMSVRRTSYVVLHFDAACACAMG